MSLDSPNCTDYRDTLLYDELVKKKCAGEYISEKEDFFIKAIYHQEECMAGLDGDYYSDGGDE